MTDKNIPKIPTEYVCKLCDYNTSSKKDFGKHILTLKHKKTDIMLTKNPKNPKNPKNLESNAIYFQCKCGNRYKHRQSLHKHNMSCKFNSNTSLEEHGIEYNKPNNITQIIEILLSKNNEFVAELITKINDKNGNIMEKMMEIIPHIGNNSHNKTTNNNTTNNNFNIQMFLNEHCKNAMNLTDFIDSLPITSETYDSTIENGLTKTITNMLVNGLSQLDILDRPIHCTDATRKTLYVKDHNIWEKDNELLHILKGIKTLSMKQRTMLNKWQDANRGWDTKDNLQSRMTRLIYNSMTSIENDHKETGKIIRAISKNVYLDTDTKNQFNQLE